MPLRILIANRGEIAVRIARSVIEMGHVPVGVYTSPDRGALHRRFLFEDVEISSYLDADEIVEAAVALGADGVHPGYGFLSESSDFARKVIKRGLVFIGPSPDAIDRAGDKLGLKGTAEKLGLPTLPYVEARSEKDVEEFAREHGYPVMLKAAGGGGGIGMRIVRSPEELRHKLEEASKEAEKAFGDSRIFVEPYVEPAKHIEVQIIGSRDEVIHLYERECSIQHRHQKIIEEAPSPSIDQRTREEMAGVAVELMKAVKYENAGTVEFLYDVRRKKFYVMEVNARIQVEHPVTESVTGVDIVKEQIRVAFEGAPSLRQADVRLRGHAIEARVNALNPLDLTPSFGQITVYVQPSGPGVRVDSGYAEGGYVPPDYSPLLAKVIAYGSTREEALRRLLRALSEFVIGGVQTNIPLLKRLLLTEDFVRGTYTTKLVEERLGEIRRGVEADLKLQALMTAVLAAIKPDASKKLVRSVPAIPQPEGRLESIKRRAWVYWVMTRSRLRRR